MQRFNSFIHWISLSSGMLHMFCCGLPFIMSLISLLSGLGIALTMPAGLDYLHHMMHDYETHLIVFSGIMLLVGGVLHAIASHLDCSSQGCCSDPCKPKKKRSAKILIVAAVLFIVNVTIYFQFHS